MDTQLRFRYYGSLSALMAGKADKTYTAPRRLSPTNEGTPSITVYRDKPGLRGLRVETGLHYFKDITGDGAPDVDRQATGTMTGFRGWKASARADLDRLFLNATAFHGAFTAPVGGSIGDRDEVTLPDGTDAVIAEAQYAPHDFGTWRLFLRDPQGGPITPLTPATPGRSPSLGNPALSVVTLADTRKVLVFTAFIFGEGAGAGEAGTVINVLPLG